MRVSFGHTKYGPVSDEIDLSWSQFIEHLQLCAAIPRAADTSAKESWHWCSPMVLTPGATHRTNADVCRMGAWFAADLDDGNLQLTDLKLRLGDTEWCAWTTTQSRCDAMRWRVIQRLDAEYDPADHPRLVAWYQSKFPENTNSISKTRNPNRIFYLPAKWEDATNLFHASHGRPARVDAILAMIPPIEQPPAPVTAAASDRTAPDGVAIITRHMIEAALSRPAGSRTYPMLCSAAKRYRLNGWTLTANELANAGRAAAALFTPPHRGDDIEREAQRAIEWANHNVSPQTPIERMRSRLLFEEARKSARRLDQAKPTI